MEIKKIYFQNGNDFSAIMKCENCGHEGDLSNGYLDTFFMETVIPTIFCKECNRNGEGNLETGPVMDQIRSRGVTLMRL